MNFITDVILPLALAFIMFTLGLGLTFSDFARVVKAPKNFIIGLISQLIFLPIVALILILTEAGALLIEALARSNDQQLAGAIIFLLTATIVFVNFITDLILAIMDPRVRKGVMGGS